MKTQITLAPTKDSDILCDIFRFRLEDFLRYYMKQVSLSGLTDKTRPGDLNWATLFFTGCTA